MLPVTPDLSSIYLRRLGHCKHGPFCCHKGSRERGLKVESSLLGELTGVLSRYRLDLRLKLESRRLEVVHSAQGCGP